VTIDVGTGDGRAVLATAAAEPATLVIGLDADAASMAESSRRAAGPARKGGLPNALFFLVAAESMPTELTGLADRVTVLFPWGSLLRGCLRLDPRVAAGIAGLVAAGGELQLLLAPSARDRLLGLPTTPSTIIDAVGHAFRPLGLEVVESRDATAQEIRRSHSTWARRLLAAGRPDSGSPARAVAFVRLRSCAA
jgi:16S rRNA (adenine(1408)-N(1))-methyltransferase